MKHFAPFGNALLLLVAMMCGSATQAADQPSHWLDELGSRPIHVEQYGRHLKVRGFALSKRVTFGHTKVAGQYGLGLVVRQRAFSWGINHRGISIATRF